MQTYPNLKPFLDELPYAHYEPIAPGITTVEATITTAVNEAVTGKKARSRRWTTQPPRPTLC